MEAPPEGAWDDDFGRNLVGATVLIGLTVLTKSGALHEQIQMFGVVSEATPSGIEIALKGSREGGVYRLPPDVRAFRPAEPGSYRLRATGEVVEDPDYTTTWTINKPD